MPVDRPEDLPGEGRRAEHDRSGEREARAADFRPALGEAVEAAQARKQDVEFDVLAPMPIAADQATQDVFTKNGATDTQAVAMAMGYAGVSLDKVHIGFRGDPGSPPREVQIYLR